MATVKEWFHNDKRSVVGRTGRTGDDNLYKNVLVIL